MATTEIDLLSLGFHKCWVKPVRLDIKYPDPTGRGPYCRLLAQDTAPERPGVYAWCVNGNVMDVGEAGELRQITQGYHMRRAYNDYTYMPASQVLRPSDPRVRVNGLLNRACGDGLVVSWWWLETESEPAARRVERELIARWRPPWNRTYPMAG